METIASEGHVLFPRGAEVSLDMMLSVPGANRGPRAGSPRGVVVATGSQFRSAGFLVRLNMKSGTGVPPVNHAQDARATTKLNQHRFSITLCFAYYQQRFIDSLCGRTFSEANTVSP